jgi:hypothetical protein
MIDGVGVAACFVAAACNHNMMCTKAGSRHD